MTRLQFFYGKVFWSVAITFLCCVPAIGSPAQVCATNGTLVYQERSLPIVGIPVLEDNLCLPHVGNNVAKVRPANRKITYKYPSSSGSHLSASSSHANVITPQMLQRIDARAVSGSLSGSQSAFSSNVGSLNEQGVSAMPHIIESTTAIQRAGVIPNPDDDPKESGAENGPIGDALLPLLLMVSVFILCKRKRLHTNKTVKNRYE